jgi:hypothetical protein
VDTALFRAGKSDAVITAIENLNPQKRLGQPDEISPVVVFVASPAASWLTGQNIRLNGVSHLPSFFSLLIRVLVVLITSLPIVGFHRLSTQGVL